MDITIFGDGNMGPAIKSVFVACGHNVTILTRENNKILADLVIFAVPYSAVSNIIERYHNQLAGKIVIDVTNPLNFETFDGLVVPPNSSGANEIQQKLRDSMIVKGFNTNFSQTLVTAKVAGNKTTVMLASNSIHAKDVIIRALKNSQVEVIDVGGLNRARELESIGFLQLTLAANETISWTGGFTLNK